MRPVEGSGTVGGTPLDSQALFSQPPHVQLQTKLSGGIKEELLKWVAGFLTNRLLFTSCWSG